MPLRDAKDAKPQMITDQMWLAFALLSVILVFLGPFLAGLAMWWFGRGRLRRSEFVIIGVTGILGILIAGGTLFTQYFSWIGALITGNGSRWAVPVLSMAVLGGVFAMAMSLLENTRIAAAGTRVLLRRDKFAKEGLIPDERQRRKAKTVTPPGGLLVSAESHSILKPSKVGERSFPIGTDSRGTPFLISEDEIRMHGLLFGSTGSGKSKTIEAIAGGLLDLGWEGMILDLKEDTDTGGLRDWCRTYAQAHARPYQELCLSDPAPDYWFNPLAGIGPDEARDAILSLSEFEAPYWRAINENMLGQMCSLLYWAHEVDPVKFPYPNLIEMGRILSAASLSQAVKKHVAVVTSALPGVEPDDFKALLQPSKDEAQSAPGFGARLTAMYATQAGRTVLRQSGNRSVLDVTQGGLTYVGLDSQGKPELTRIVSSSMLQRLSVYAAMRTTGRGEGKKVPRFLIVDEANWVDRGIVQNLLSRARGAGISMILATQGPKDWIDRDGDDFAKLGQNTNVAIIMSQGEPESAEICADYIGKEERVEVSRQVIDNHMYDVGKTRIEERHRITPDELRALQIGEAIVRIGKPTERISWVAVRVRDPRVGPGAQGGGGGPRLVAPPG